MRPLLLSAVPSPSPHFTAAVNDTLADIVSVLNGSSVNLTVAYSQYAKAVVFHYCNITPTLSSSMSNSSSNCVNQAILNHVHKTDYAAELVELFENISAAIKILKQVHSFIRTHIVKVHKLHFISCGIIPNTVTGLQLETFTGGCSYAK